MFCCLQTHAGTALVSVKVWVIAKIEIVNSLRTRTLACILDPITAYGMKSDHAVNS